MECVDTRGEGERRTETELDEKTLGETVHSVSSFVLINDTSRCCCLHWSQHRRWIGLRVESKV